MQRNGRANLVIAFLVGATAVSRGQDSPPAVPPQTKTLCAQPKPFPHCRASLILENTILHGVSGASAGEMMLTFELGAVANVGKHYGIGAGVSGGNVSHLGFHVGPTARLRRWSESGRFAVDVAPFVSLQAVKAAGATGSITWRDRIGGAVTVERTLMPYDPQNPSRARGTTVYAGGRLGSTPALASASGFALVALGVAVLMVIEGGAG